MQVLHDKYRFLDHCLAIKRYLLLGQGDFMQALMDGVGEELNKSSADVSKFQLTGEPRDGGLGTSGQRVTPPPPATLRSQERSCWLSTAPTRSTTTAISKIDCK